MSEMAADEEARLESKRDTRPESGLFSIPPPALNDQPLVLFVDDDPSARALVGRWLERAGFRFGGYPDAESLLTALATTLPDTVCIDLGLPGMGGLEAIPLVRRAHRSVPIIILSGERAVDTVVQAMQAGAFDYLPKPVDRTKLITSVQHATDRHRLEVRVAQLERELDARGKGGLIGRSPAIREVFRQLERVAPSDISVLVHGESGTGKELVARAIHDGSARSGGPFVAVNCAAIPETLQESELFGHERGAFTGAEHARAGRFEQANGGTLFLDEIAELSLPLQAKLLRVLQDRRFERLGAQKTTESDFRLVSATHQDLHDMVQRGRFREDLYFRVAVFELEIPPLRDRKGDVALLAEALLEQLQKGERKLRLDPRALEALEAYHWPGNVRDLQNVLQRASVLSDGAWVRVEDLPPRLFAGLRPPLPETAPAAPDPGPAKDSASPLTAMTLEELERWAITQAMHETNGNVAEVIRRLGLSRTTLYRKLKDYWIR